jgi:hypothetical protein
VLDVLDCPIDGTFGSNIDHTLSPSIDLSGITEPVVWLVAQPGWMDTSVPMPYGDIATIGHDWRASFLNGGVPRGALGPFFSPGPNVLCTTPRWRYWIPETAWHTVGGHFATKGGVTPKILTPGVGWVDVVDGPAA